MAQHVNRQTFIASALCAAADTIVPRRARAAGPVGAAFSDWILRYQIAPSGLCRYFRFGAHDREESPLATAYAILWLLGSEPATAQKLGETLIDLQSASSGNRYTRGAVPSVANAPNPLYYSSDALICAKAMMALWRATQAQPFLTAAGRFVDFVLRMMDVPGFLTSNVGFPMQYVTRDGDYQNELVPNVGMLFFDALQDYGEGVNNLRILRQFEAGRAFLSSQTQAANGAFYDHYDPGYPPVRYSTERWRWFGNNTAARVGISDNMLMSALGAQALGDAGAVQRYLDWARPVDGSFYAYVNVDTNEPAFIPKDQPYFDVVCSGMYSVLRAQAHASPDPAALRALMESRAPDGGFRWGRLADGSGWVDGGGEALVTGYWAALALEPGYVNR